MAGRVHAHLARCLAASALAVMASGCGSGGAGDGPPPAPEVVVESPQEQSVTDWLYYTGRFEAIEAVDIRARVSGYLESVHFEDGDEVEKGDLLFTIDPRPFEAALAAAEGALAQARATLSQSRTERARADELIDIGGVSREELDALVAAEARAAAAVKTAEANLRAARLDLEFAEVRAPIAGRLSERRIDPGNLIAGGGVGADILTTIVSYDPIHFSFDVSEADVLKYLQGRKRNGVAEIEIRLLGETAFSRKGLVTFADNRIDPQAGTLRLRAQMDNPDGVLQPGMFGEARVNAFEPYKALTVPEAAIVTDASRRLVYVVGADNKVESRAVELGPLIGDRRVIRSGLNSQDRVIVAGLQRARPGAPVQPSVKDDDAPSRVAADGEAQR